MSGIQFITTSYPQLPDNHSTHRIEMAEEDALQALTQLPILYLIIREGAGVDAESGEPMEFGIFDFYKVFSRAFIEEGNGAART